MEPRKEMLPDRYKLPSRFWEPEPDEEDLERLEQENRFCSGLSIWHSVQGH